MMGNQKKTQKPERPMFRAGYVYQPKTSFAGGKIKWYEDTYKDVKRTV